MAKFVKKPVIIEAHRIPLNGGGWEWAEFERWGIENLFDYELDDNCNVKIETLEGVMVGNPGDWVIKGVQGEFYPCKNDIFKETYSPSFKQK